MRAIVNKKGYYCEKCRLYRQVDMQTDRQADRETDRRTDRQDTDIQQKINGFLLKEMGLCLVID